MGRAEDSGPTHRPGIYDGIRSGPYRTLRDPNVPSLCVCSNDLCSANMYDFIMRQTKCMLSSYIQYVLISNSVKKLFCSKVSRGNHATSTKTRSLGSVLRGLRLHRALWGRRRRHRERVGPARECWPGVPVASRCPGALGRPTNCPARFPPKTYMTAARDIGEDELLRKVLGPRLRPQVRPRV